MKQGHWNRCLVAVAGVLLGIEPASQTTGLSIWLSGRTVWSRKGGIKCIQEARW